MTPLVLTPSVPFRSGRGSPRPENRPSRARRRDVNWALLLGTGTSPEATSGASSEQKGAAGAAPGAAGAGAGDGIGDAAGDRGSRSSGRSRSRRGARAAGAAAAAGPLSWTILYYPMPTMLTWMRPALFYLVTYLSQNRDSRHRGSGTSDSLKGGRPRTRSCHSSCEAPAWWRSDLRARAFIIFDLCLGLFAHIVQIVM